MHHFVVEQWSRGRSLLHGRDARVKIGLLLSFLVALALTPRMSAPASASFAGLLLAAILVGRLPPVPLLLRAMVVLPFSAAFAVFSVLGGDPQRAADLLVKSYLSAAAVLVLAGTTPLPKLLRGLESLGAPKFLVLVVQFLYRYLFVISEQAQHMRLAAASRGSRARPFRRDHLGFRAGAGAVAVLFARSYGRAEGIHRAMLARGFGERLPDGAGAGARGGEPRPLIEVHGLRYRYADGTLALDGVDFALLPGESVALLGPNGSGKTTFVHHLNGLLAGEGSISVCGLALEKKNLPAIRRKIGLVFQDSDEQLFMPTVLEDVAFGPLNQGLGEAEALRAAKHALEQVGMAEALEKAPYHLSAGEKKRVALAGVLVMDPEILVLDEPTTFLDPPAQRGLLALLRRLPQAKIIVTHDALFAGALARRAVFFQKGRIVAAGPVDEIVQRFRWDSRAGAEIDRGV